MLHLSVNSSGIRMAVAATLIAVVIGHSLSVNADAKRVANAVRVEVVNDAGQSQACNIYLRNAAGEIVLPEGYPVWKDHFTCDGTATFALAAGNYHYEIDCGPEFKITRGTWAVSKAGNAFSVVAERLLNLPAAGWYAADLHIHRPVEQTPLLMDAAGLSIAPVITWWNATNPWKTHPLPLHHVSKAGQDGYIDILAGEDERGGGALIYYHLHSPVDITAADREYPSSVEYLRQARTQNPDVHISIEKPFWRDVPLWLSTGHIDSIGIAHNHLWRDGLLDNEAWGMPRDRQEWPSPDGLGLWTQELYYRILNCGYRIPPIGGSASGVLPNPVGYNRCYAFVEGDLSYAKWWQALERGRVMVTNGPLLQATANEELPGHEFPAKMKQIALDVTVTSNDPVSRVEVIHNGRVIHSWTPENATKSRWQETIDVPQDGWFLVRALADHPATFRFASTGPFYLGPQVTDREAASDASKFFLTWALQRRQELADSLNAAERQAVLEDHEEAIRFWKSRIEQLFE